MANPIEQQLQLMQQMMMQQAEQVTQLTTQLTTIQQQLTNSLQQQGQLEARLALAQNELQQQTQLSQQTKTELEQRLQQANAAFVEQQNKVTALENSRDSNDKPLIHPSNIPKPKAFSGQIQDWEEFKHVFLPWLGTVHREYPSLIKTAGDSADPLESDDYTDEVKQLSHGPYTISVGYCSAATMSTVGQGGQESNGFEVWRRLVKQFESAPRTKAWIWRKA